MTSFSLIIYTMLPINWYHKILISLNYHYQYSHSIKIKRILNMTITFSNEEIFYLYHSVSTIDKSQILDLHSIFWFPSIPVRLIANRDIVKYFYFLWGVKQHLTTSTLRAPRKYVELHRHCWSRHSTSRYSSILFWLSIGDSYWTLSPFSFSLSLSLSPSHSLFVL